MNIKDYAKAERRLEQGHKTCQGCGIPINMRFIMSATKKPLVVGVGTACASVTTMTYPYTSWKCPAMHNAFASLASSMAGVEAAYRAFKKKGKVKDDIRIVCFGGDGGSYDIGLQSLSGMIERKHKIVYVCYDNQAYMNTGNQKSGATEYGTATTTTPAGRVHVGKELFRKDLTEIIAGHDDVYVAQAALSNYTDITMKAQKAFEFDGPSFINVISPCTLFWGIPTGLTFDICKLAVETCVWPLYEVENGVHKLNYKPVEKRPVADFLAPQKRFKHLLLPENKKILNELQEYIDKKWEKLLKRCGEA